MEDSDAIASRNNPLVKRIKRLQQNARYRAKEKAFWAEGSGILATAFQEDGSFEIVVYCESLFADEPVRATLERCRAAHIRCVAVSEMVFRLLSQRNNPDGLGAICTVDWLSFEALKTVPSDVLIAAEELSDPGNLGTLLRTMEAVKATALILVGQTTQPFHPRAVRASRGAIFTIPVYHCPNTESLLDWSTARGIQTIATSSRADRSYWDALYRLPVLLLFGSENRGLRQGDLKSADQCVSIPMGGKTSSLNVSVAFGVIAYHFRSCLTAKLIGQ